MLTDSANGILMRIKGAHFVFLDCSDEGSSSTLSLYWLIDSISLSASNHV